MKKDSIKQALIADYLDNKISFNSLAKKYDINRNTISQIIHSSNIQTKYFTNLPEAEIVELYVKERWSKEKVAKKFGVSITPIKRIILKNGYLIRNSSDCHKGQQAWNKGKAWSEEVRMKIRNKSQGRFKEANPNWRGGIATKQDKRRNLRIVKAWRKSCLERDQKCLWCGSLEKLEVNHIIPIRQIKEVEMLGDMNNGITLCQPCHRSIYRKENEYEDILRNLLKNHVNSGNIQKMDNPDPIQSVKAL